METKHFFIKTIGCRQIQHDVERYAIFFQKNGWKKTENIKKADLVIFNTCGVVQELEDRSFAYILKISKELGKDVPFLVGGCLPKINPKRLLSVPNIKVIDRGNEYILDKFFKKKVSIKDVFWNSGEIGNYWTKDRSGDIETENRKEKMLSDLLSVKFNNQKYVEIYDYLVSKGGLFYLDKDLFEIRVGDGCNNHCAYCAIKKAKGKLKSYRLSDIIKEFKYGLGKGYKKFILLADEVGDYGSDLGTSLADLLEKMTRLSEDCQIEIDYISPQSLVRQFDRLEKFFSTKRVNYFRSPIQSGSPKILRSMNRPADLTRFIEIMDIIEKEYPWVYKLSQVIVGFPGETEHDFQITLKVLKRCNFDHVKVHHYSVRSGTKAAEFKNNIGPDVINERFEKAVSLLDDMRQEKFKNRIFSELLDETENKFGRQKA